MGTIILTATEILNNKEADRLRNEDRYMREEFGNGGFLEIPTIRKQNPKLHHIESVLLKDS